MKTRHFILRLIAFVFTLVIVSMCIFIGALLLIKPSKLDVKDVQLDIIENGMYYGESKYGLVKVSLEVEIQDGEIKNIHIINHEHVLGKKAENVIDQIIDQQSIEIDGISSTTYSSEAIKKAVENALRKEG